MHEKGKGQIEEVEDFGVAEAPSYLKKLHIHGDVPPKKEGFVGIYAVKTDTPFYLAYEDNSVFEILVENIVHRIKDLKFFMEQCWRVLVPKGVITILSPYFTSISACEDYETVRVISETSFNFFNKKILEQNKLTRELKCNFERVYTRFYFEPEWELRNTQAQEWARQHYFNTVRVMEIALRAIKE